MTKTWELEQPLLLVSVIGGGAQTLSKETRLKTALTEVFRKGAWIITGGVNTGVMKLVADAIRAHILKQRSWKQLVTIGIASWGCISNREALIVETDETESSEVHRTSPMALYESAEPLMNEAPLDPNNTHFILFDDGTQHRFDDDIKLRSSFEKKLSSVKTWGVKIPVVCVVIEGGRKTIEAVRHAIETDTPVIVIEGSGRAADVLAYAYNNYTEPSEEDKSVEEEEEEDDKKFRQALTARIVKAFGEESLDDVLSSIMVCLDHRNMITVFPLEGKGSSRGIDYAIVTTLLRVKEGETSTLEKMKLALAWDRIDIVKEQIYTGETKLKPGELQDLAFTAIVNNRVDFVKFCLERRLRLNELLQKHEINEFYAEALKSNQHLKDVLKEYKVDDCGGSTDKLDNAIHKLVSRLFHPANWRAEKVFQRQLSQSRGEDIKLQALRVRTAIDDAAMDLFFWAILNRLQSMAIVFLCEAKETFALSLIGHLMLKNLLKKEKDLESAQELQKQVDFFEGFAAGLLTACCSSNQEMTLHLLVRPIKTFAMHRAFDIAVHADNRSLLAHQACQNLLTFIWTKNISDDNSRYLMMLLCIPPGFLLAPMLLKFRDETSTLHRNPTKDVAADPERKVSQDGRASTAAAPQLDDVQSKENLCFVYFKRLGYFLTAPCVKFTFNCVSYTVFLVFFSILLLTNFYSKISTAEFVLIAWVATLAFEEIRQIIESRDGSSRKFGTYLSNKWNWVDMSALATFLVGLGLRLVPLSTCSKCFFAARIILALSLMAFYFRILHMFFIFRQLGPKLVMIGEMMIDLFYFMAILLVFIVAYGVTANVILYPNQELNVSLASGLLRGAWWSVYGEFNIEEVSGESCEAASSSSLQSSSSFAEDCASMNFDDFNRTMCRRGKDEKCPAIDWFVPILLAVYALVTNVLMINLLIAMFSNTFAKVEGIADVIWKIQRCHLVLDYASHPILPQPIIVLEHVFLLIRAICRNLRSVCTKRNDAGHVKQFPSVRQSVKSRHRAFKMKMTEYYERNLIVWLKANVEEFLLKQETVNIAVAGDSLAKETNIRIDQLCTKIEEMEHRRSHAARLKSVKQRFNCLDQNLSSLIDRMSQENQLLTPKS